ncbi:MAG: hypothetical protein WKG52_00775 [Variovorax sp.]
MKVTNNTANPMVVGTTHIGPGSTEHVAEWDTVKDSYPVQHFLKAEAISVAKPVKKTGAESEAEERTALFAELDKVGATYDKKAKTPDLLVILEDAKKKAAGQ